MNLLKRANVPPYPQFYELLYTYATGANPALNARINAIFRSSEGTPELGEQLYNELLKAQQADERLSSVSERMSDRITSMFGAIDSAMATANAYSASLQVAGGDLGGNMTADDLKALTLSLLSETRRMQDANLELEKNLESSRADILALQQDLEDVRREALLDPLTKLHNRKAFDEGLLRLVGQARERGTPLCLMLIDIDHFKSFNDTWGHQTGDQVLRLVAMTIKSHIKNRDIAARYGGEEFAAILPDTDQTGGTRLAEQIRQAIQSKELLKRSTNEKLGRVTASFGVAILRDSDTPSSLIDRADVCLYAAKNGGRNRVANENDIVESEVVAA